MFIALSTTALVCVHSKEPSQNASLRYEKSYYQGLSYIGQQEFAKAIEKFNQSIKENPCNFEKARNSPKNDGPKKFLASIYEKRGLAYLLTGNYTEGIKDTNKAIELRPDYPQIYLNRASAYHTLGKNDLAESDMLKAEKLGYVNVSSAKRAAQFNARGKPTDRLNYFIRAEDHVQSKQFERAIQDYTQVINLDPDKFGHINLSLDQLYFRRAAANISLKRYDEAIADYSKLLQFDAEDETAYIRRGDAYKLKNDLQHALADYSKAITLDPRNAATAYLSRAKVYDMLGKKELANSDRAAAQKQGREFTDRW